MVMVNLEVYDHRMPHSAERTHPAQELPPLTPGEQELRDAILLPEYIRKPLLDRFDTAVQEELDTCIHPADRQLISKAASIIRWEWFAQPGEPLPAGTAIDSSGFQVELLDRTHESKRFSVNQHLIGGCLFEIAGIRDDIITDHLNPKIEKALATIVREQPIYQLLHAVASDEPKQQDLPLSRAERMIRESQEEHDVRQKHGLSRNTPLRAHPDAHTRLQKRLYQLDEETIPKHADKQSDSRSRLLNFVLDVFNTMSHGINGEPIVKLGRSDDGGLTGTTQSGNSDWIGGLAYETSYDYCDQLDDKAITESYTRSRAIIENLTYLLTANEHRSRDGIELLEAATLESSRGRRVFGALITRSISADIRTYLLGIDAPVMGKRYGFLESWKKPSNTLSAQVHSVESLTHDKSRIIGQVYETSPLQHGQTTAGRLIIPSDVHAQVTTSPGTYDFMLRLNNHVVLGKGGAPFISGYKLVGHDGERWFFEHVNPDPYSGADQIKLETTQLQGFSDYCQTLGLRTLAKTLRSSAELSLTDMVSAIRESSDYTFDQSRALPRDTEELDFARLVDSDGRLQVQCTGAAAFLCHALKTVMPESKAVPISGVPIQHNGVVALLGHAQVMLTLNGNQYILDATPASEFFSATAVPYASSGNTQNGTPQPEQTNELANQTNHDGAQIITTTAQQHQEQLEKQAQNVFARTKQQLKGHFNLPLAATDDKLYEHVARLKKDADPIRRVLELVLRREQEQDISRRLEQEKQYLLDMIDADTHVFQQIGVPRYTPTLLNMLLRTIEDLEIQSR